MVFHHNLCVPRRWLNLSLLYLGVLSSPVISAWEIIPAESTRFLAYCLVCWFAWEMRVLWSLICLSAEIMDCFSSTLVLREKAFHKLSAIKSSSFVNSFRRFSIWNCSLWCQFRRKTFPTMFLEECPSSGNSGGYRICSISSTMLWTTFLFWASWAGSFPVIFIQGFSGSSSIFVIFWGGLRSLDSASLPSEILRLFIFWNSMNCWYWG